MDKLLIVDDNAEIRKQLEWGLGKAYRLFFAEDRSDALAGVSALGADDYARDEIEAYAAILKRDPERWARIVRAINGRVEELRRQPAADADAADAGATDSDAANVDGGAGDDEDANAGEATGAPEDADTTAPEARPGR